VNGFFSLTVWSVADGFALAAVTAASGMGVPSPARGIVTKPSAFRAAAPTGTRGRGPSRPAGTPGERWATARARSRPGSPRAARRPARPSRAPAGAAIPGAGTRARPGRRPTRGWRAPQRAARRRPAAPWPRRPASGRRHGRWPSGSARGVPGAIAGRAFAAIGGAHRVTGLVGRAWRARLIAVPAQAAISSATTRRPAPWGGDQVPLDGAYLAVLTSIFRTESLFSTFRPMRS